MTGTSNEWTKRKEQIERVAIETTKMLIADGKLIEGGWAAFAHILLKGANPQQLSDMRVAYLAGAEHLYSSIMTMLEAGAEPTAGDMRRMELIDNEIQMIRAMLAQAVGTGD